MSYGYPASGSTSVRPHTPSTVGGAAYSYDNNGNLLSGGGRTYTWTPENLPATITSGGVTETYGYDADSERVTRTVGGATTVYLGALIEQTGGAVKRYYSFNGANVAVRSASGVSYLYGDHLGSMGASSDGAGGTISRQWFDAWGDVQSGALSATTLNYTGQRLDGTGLLYYHARY